MSALESRLFGGVPTAEITAPLEEVQDENRERSHRQLVPVRQLGLVRSQVKERRILVIVEVLRRDCVILSATFYGSEKCRYDMFKCANLPSVGMYLSKYKKYEFSTQIHLSHHPLKSLPLIDLLVIIVFLVAVVIALEVEFRSVELSRAELNIVAPQQMSVFPMTSQIVTANRP